MASSISAWANPDIATSLVVLIDVGEQSKINWAHDSAVVINSSIFVTSFTKPRFKPSAALTVLPVSIILIALFNPICLGSRCIPPAKAAKPTFGSGSANFAFSEAIIKSQAKAISKPPPIATPLTAAISGLFKLKREVKPAKPELFLSIFPPSAWYLRSLPAQKALSPSPVIIATQASSSLEKSSNIFSNSKWAGEWRAFILSGLFKVIIHNFSFFSNLENS